MSILTESQSGRISGIGRDKRADTGEAGLPEDGKSYVRGATEPPLVYATVPQMLRDTVSRYGPREALVFCETGARLTYYDLDRRVDALAGGFLALGVEKGDRVGIWAPNRLEWVLTQFATARIGAVLVNINPAYRVNELEYALKVVGCKVLVTAPAFKTSDYLGMIAELAPELAGAHPGRLQAARLPALRAVVSMEDIPSPGCIAFAALETMGGPAQQLRLATIDATLSPDDAINIQFTSGTTGSPKGATLSHYSITNNARFVTDRIGLTEADRLAVPVPLYHCFGMVMGVLGAVSKGATLVFPGQGFEPDTVLDAVAAERCTALYGVPTMFVAMLAALDSRPRDLASLRTGIMAGALCPVEVMRRVQRQMHMTEVTICYGMTETSPVSFQSFTDDPLEKRCETVGRVHPHLEVKIVDGEGQIVPMGVAGELCTRGYSVMKGYWQDRDKTDETVRDGWMHTGDLATLDADGFCTITGRLKDMIIRGGENIYPREIEEILNAHPQVSDAQVFGIPDPKYGEEVCAFVLAAAGPAPDPEALRDHCRAKMAYFKVPKHIRVIESFPATITGKPQKFVMRDMMTKALGVVADPPA
ncbi:MAG: AMP-binding protein [Pseudooceanicola sp.]|jgi:fatty-acyl-CoA synthase|nr:AMP-binding protein [Pseudooceanicola sp.]